MKNNNTPLYSVSADIKKLDMNTVFSFLASSYWAKGRSKNVIRKSIDNSLCFGLYHKDKQIGFARVITDYAVFAYLADVFIHEDFRGKGAGKTLLEEIFKNPDLKNVKKWMLATKDAQKFYEKFGFIQLKNPQKYMEYTSPVND